MLFLSEHIKKTIDIASGYTTGQLVVEGEMVGLLRDSGEVIELDEKSLIEVRNGDVYEQITIKEALTTETIEGWPLYAGLYTRVKGAIK